VPLSIPLKLKGPRTAGLAGFTVTVINGSDRSAVGDARVKASRDAGRAIVADILTNSNGEAKLTLVAGAYTVTATRGDDITSNRLKVVVS
jgi:hypothetical protein